MHLPIAGRAAALIVVSILFLTACSSGSEGSQIQSGTVVSNTVADDSTTTTSAQTQVDESSSTSELLTNDDVTSASAEAESFKILAPTISELGDGVFSFVEGTEPVRIDELAEQACNSVTVDMSDNEVGLQGLAAYNELTADEAQLIDLEDWVVFYGAMIGFFCPEQLPNFDAQASAPLDGAGAEGFRTIISDVDGVSVETETFVAGLDDQRLDDLQASACANTDPEMNTEDFGVAIIDSFGSDLTSLESDAISLSGYSEFYGALVGWFCPSNLPR